MNILETVGRAKAHLEEHGRVSLRVLKREFDLDDEALEELVAELVDIQQVAAREGNALAWVGPTTGAGTAQQSRAAEPDRTPRDYTPKHLVDKILTSRSALEGERKQVSVLFADVTGSVELSDALDPERWHAILERFFEILADGVHRFEGTVNQYTGDGIMALFGAPLAHEDHAQRACHAALQLRDALRRFTDRLRVEEGLNFSVRLGLNSGEVVVGKIGDDLRMDYTAQGRVVGLASRMQALAESGRVTLAEDTARLVEGYFRLRDLGPTRVKGIAEPVRVYELEAPGRIDSRFELARARGLSRFVGREREMAVLEEALEHARAGERSGVAVVGEAGVGKSRLCHEFAGRCRERGLRLASATCPRYGSQVPFLFSTRILRSLFGVEEGESDELARDKIAGRLTRLDPELACEIPFMCDIAGVPDPLHPAPEMSVEERRARLVSVQDRMLEARSGLGEVQVFIFDDLQWVDPASQSVLAGTGSMAGGSTLVVANYRPEYRYASVDEGRFQEISLEPLAKQEVRALIASLLGPDPGDPGLVGAIAERAAGNPFFAEELVRGLADSGTLEGEPGAHRLAKPIGEIALPASVRDLLAARIDRLPEEAKALLQEASVIGKSFPAPLLVNTSGRSAPAVEDALAALEEAGFVRPERPLPEAEYAFVHPLTQEVAYTSQLAARRARSHAAVGRALAEGGASEQDAALIAHHFEQAGQKLEAARWHGRAAEWLTLRDASAALTHARRARDLLAGEDSGQAAALRLRACVRVLNEGWRVGLRDGEGEEVHREGLALAEAQADPGAASRIQSLWGAMRGTRGELDTYRELTAAAIGLAEEADDLEALVVASGLHAVALARSGDSDAVLTQTARLIALAPDPPHLGRRVLGFAPWIIGLGSRTEVLSALGRLPEAEECLARAQALVRQHGDPTTRCLLDFQVATYLEIRGEERGELERMWKTLELANGLGSPYTLALAHAVLGLTLAVAERPAEAREHLERALDLIAEHRVALHLEPLPRAALARVLLELGEAEAALVHARAAVELSDRMGALGFAALHRPLLAVALVEAGGPAALDDAERELARAEAIGGDSGQVWHRPRALEARATLARIRGDQAERRSALERARDAFREMGADGHVRRLNRELAS
jgi:class 3 adenylate cyclase/tetratricopeptide (TPR) repeat protein